MKKILTYIAVIAASVGLFFYLFTTQVQATNLFLSTVGTSTFPGGINMGTGCYAIGGVCLTSSTAPTGSTGQVTYFSGTNTAVGTSTIFVTAASRVGIGTTTPLRTFVVEGPNTSGGVMLIQRDTGSTNTASLFTALRAHAYTTAATYAAGYGTSISFDISTSSATNNFMGLVGAYRSATNDYSGILEIGANTAGVGTQYFQLIDGSNGAFSFATSTVSVDSYAFQNAGNLTNAATFYSNTGAPLLRLSNAGVLSLNGVQIPKFGGTGVNGALALTSGTTTISLGNASYYELDYTSVSISGTGNLTFSNPNANGSLVVIRSQGNVTLTCTNQFCISVRGLGAAGGAGAAACNTNLINGTIGNQGNAFYLFGTNGGVGGSTSAAGGALPTAIAPASWAATSTPMKYGGQFWVGAGGGGGSCGANAVASSNGGGAGGAGGGSLLMEVGGALNMTATNAINATGIAGGTNTTVSGNTCAHGGGGGAGGLIRVIYNTLTSVAGTMLVSGGAGGVNTCINSGDSVQNGAGGGGGGGGYTAGSAGSASVTNNAVTGGAGANGVSNTELNTNF